VKLPWASDIFYFDEIIMLITEKLGNTRNISIIEDDIDVVSIEWFETNKRILHKQTRKGQNITLKFLKENHALADGDILWKDQNTVIVVEIKDCKCIVVTPVTTLTAAAFCYEIGNRHMPVYYEGNDLLIPYEVTVYNLLEALGYQLRMEERKLNTALKTTVLPHLRLIGTGSIHNPGQLLTSS
jgi:urease accessory protein